MVSERFVSTKVEGGDGDEEGEGKLGVVGGRRGEDISEEDVEGRRWEEGTIEGDKSLYLTFSFHRKRTRITPFARKSKGRKITMNSESLK